MNYIIRKGKKEDLPQVLDLIKELAQYEKAPQEVTVTIQELEEDSFGTKPIFYFFVAEFENKILGTAIYYIKYSTWKGKCIFLEDIIVSEELKNALDKYKKLFKEKKSAEIDYSVLLSALNKNKGEFQKRIVIRYGEIIKTVEIVDVAYFYTESKINFLYTFKNQRFSVDHNLDELEHILNPKEFFRINRQFIVNVKAIDKMVTVSKSRVKLTLNPPCEIETIVSTERSSYFKDWLTGQ